MCHTLIVNGMVAHRLRSAWTPDSAETAALPTKAVRWLTRRIGRLSPGAPPAPDSAFVVPPSRIPENARAEPAQVVGTDHGVEEAGGRLGRPGRLSHLDLV